MKDSLRRRYEMLLRVRDFGVQYATFFLANTLAHLLFIELGVIIGEIEQLAAAQQSNSRGAREGTTNRGESRTDLREEMEAMSATARAMAISTPGMEDKFRMPRGNCNDVDLLNAARAFAADALPLKDEFIRHEMPEDFLDRLNAAIVALEQAIDRQQRSRRSQVSSTSTLDDAVERGVNKVRQLDPIVRNKFRDDPGKLAEWENARHTTRAPLTDTKPPTPTPTPTT
ncbi:MAG: hypothetical protein ICV60_20385 [Pyrinomonadaceae bacterium]|nr:hypothetical protein [Pyrinomonadaceae bacterium]